MSEEILKHLENGNILFISFYIFSVIIIYKAPSLSDYDNLLNLISVITIGMFGAIFSVHYRIKNVNDKINNMRFKK